MKILKIFGVVVGIHVFALMLIFANPGCSSTSRRMPAPSDTVSDSTPPPSITVPSGTTTVTVPGGQSSPISPAPVTFNPDAPAAAVASGGTGPGVRFTPTRPGTPAATTLAAEPVTDVTPATTYTVVNGDNLWNLSKKFKISVSEIATANGIKTNAVLHGGQKLLIPGKPLASFNATAASEGGATTKSTDAAAAKPPGETVKHIVKPGETLSTIAQQYGVRQGDIAVANNISDPQKIRAGTELTIPGWQAASGKNGKAVAPKTATKAGGTKAPEPKTIFNVQTDANVAAPVNAAPVNAVPVSDVPVIRIDESPVTPAPTAP